MPRCPIAALAVACSTLAMVLPASADELLMSRGTIIKVLEWESEPAPSRDELRTKPTAIVLPGTIMVAPGAPTRVAEDLRYKVLTEDGLWGYLKKGPYYLTSAQLNQVLQQCSARGFTEAAMIVANDGPAGPGETWCVAQRDDARTLLAPLDAQIAAAARMALDAGVAVSSDSVRVFDAGILDTDRWSFSKRFAERSAIREIQLVSAKLNKPCGAQLSIEDTRTGETVYSAKIGSEVNLDLMSKATVKLGLDAGWSKKIESKVVDKTAYSESVDVFSRFYYREMAEPKTLELMLWNACITDFGSLQPGADKAYRLEPSDSSPIFLNRATVQQLAESTGVHFKFWSTTGQVEVSCLREYLALKHALEDLNLSAPAATFLLSRVLRLSDPTDVSKCRYSDPS